MPRVLTAIGTRAEATGMAPLVLELRRYADIEVVVVASGESREPLGQLLSSLGIAANLELTAPGDDAGLAPRTARLLEGLTAALRTFAPGAVLVLGCGTTAVAAALAAFYARIPLGHVEVDPGATWPEGMQHCLIGAVARWCFLPSEQARLRRLGEGGEPERMHVADPAEIAELLRGPRAGAGER
jgi:UDP-N-acetylglucosamine 2-epimerase (non-hydrolysing)